METSFLGPFIILSLPAVVLLSKEIHIGFVDSSWGMRDRGPAITMAVEDFQAMGFLQDCTFK